MELLAVMAVMMLLATIGMTSYFSAVRGMNKRRATDNLTKTLTAIRQRACVDAAPTQFLCFNVWSGAQTLTKDRVKQMKALTPTYVTCKAIGRITCVNQGYPGDEFTPLDRLFGAARDANEIRSSGERMRLFNLTKNDWSEVGTKVFAFGGDELYSGTAGRRLNTTGNEQMAWCFVVLPDSSGGATWEVGDVYGIEVQLPMSLPKGVFFGPQIPTIPTSVQSSGSDKTLIAIRFYPDGRVDFEKGNSISLITLDSRFEAVDDRATILIKEDGDISLAPTWQK